jgi:type II secretory pathway pseudopilin PulG
MARKIGVPRLSPRWAAGFTYLTILFVVAFMGLGLAVAGQVWHTAVMRDREAELLYAGNQYRRAIERYYRSGQQYPRALEDLLKDPRQPGTVRYLRKLYYEPITGKNEWGTVKAPNGVGIMGVYSPSEDKPLKTAGFGIFNREFEGAAKYSDWKFVYPSAAQQQLPVQPSQQPGAPQQQVPLQQPQQPGASLPQGPLQPLQQPGTPMTQMPMQPPQQQPSGPGAP